MDKFIIFFKDDYLYALCINKTPVHIFLENKYIVLKYKDILCSQKTNYNLKLIHKKYYENMNEELINADSVNELRIFFRNILGYYKDELLSELNTVD